MEEEGCSRTANVNKKVARELRPRVRRLQNIKGRVARGLQIGRGRLQAFWTYAFYLGNSTETDFRIGGGGLQTISKLEQEGCRRAVNWNTQVAKRTGGLQEGRKMDRDWCRWVAEWRRRVTGGSQMHRLTQKNTG